ncbi:MAG TPA: double zinc ribbon domain-containing protein [bacterium]|nr:double zinc ribbon domain-containing protein [bacterium]
MEKLINAVFPPRCVFCGALGDVFCENCMSNCTLLKEQRCLVCDRPSKNGETHPYHYVLEPSQKNEETRLKDQEKQSKPHSLLPSQFISPFIYENNVRECIRKSKYSSRLFSCLKRLSFEGVNIVYEWGLSFEGFIVVPIPVSKQKEKLRGFNQADIISKIFAKRFNIPVDTSILTRIKDKHAQHSLSRNERFENIKNSFEVGKQGYGVLGKKFVLVDDICTTGATFLESSRVLFYAGALDVKCFALSKKL